MKYLILLTFFVFIALPSLALAERGQVQIGPEEYGYRTQLEQSLERVRASYLNLPKRNITYNDIQELKKEVEDLDEIVSNINLGNFSIKEITYPLEQLDKAFRKLKRQNKYSQSAVYNIRRWCNYLLKEPITYTFLAKDDVLHGREALMEGRFEEAKGYLQRAGDHLLKIRKRSSPKLRAPIQRIESEITIFYTAAVREEIIEKKKARGVVRAIAKSFDTYHDSVFNMWSDIPAYERY